MMRVRAHENGIPACFAHPRESLICGADGAIAAYLLSSHSGVLVYDLDLTRNVPMQVDPDKEVAGSKPLQNRRPKLYQALVEPLASGRSEL